MIPQRSPGVTLPTGRHQHQPLSTVPTSYLLWALRDMRLSSGVRSAVRAQLQARGVRLPPEPPPRAVRCPGCGGGDLRVRWQAHRAGQALRGECRRCGRFCGWLPQVPEYLSLVEGRRWRAAAGR
jgi:hypothetical protein